MKYKTKIFNLHRGLFQTSVLFVLVQQNFEIIPLISFSFVKYNLIKRLKR